MPRIKMISECPRCGSIRTGIIQFDFEPVNKAFFRFAKKGCYVRQYSPSEYKKYHIAPNSFCSDCNYEWVGTHETKNLPRKEYDEYLHERGLDKDFTLPSGKFIWIKKGLSCIWHAIHWR